MTKKTELNNMLSHHENKIIQGGDNTLYKRKQFTKQKIDDTTKDKIATNSKDLEKKNEIHLTNILEREKYMNFVCLYIGYIGLVFCRKSFSFVLPFIVNDGTFSKSDLG